MLLPSLQMIFHLLKEKPILENRKLAELPPFENPLISPLYQKRLLDWFNDHFGFRSLLIRVKYQIDYSLFNASNRIHIGTDGWLFYRSVMDFEKPGTNEYLEKNSKEVVQGVKNLAAMLKKKNVKLIIMIAPMKDVFYAQHLPKTVGYSTPFNEVSNLESKLKKIDNVFFLDSRNILKETSKSRPVFHKTDFHWNDPAAFDVAKSLVNDLAKSQKQSNPLWTYPLKIITRETSGGEAQFMPTIWPINEQALFLEDFKYPEHLEYTNPLPLEVYESSISNKNLLPPMVMIGDSFLDGMSRTGMQMYFSKISRAHWNKITLKKLVDNLPTDTRYLLIEFIEVSGGAYQQLAEFSKLKSP